MTKPLINYRDFYPGLSREEVIITADALMLYIENAIGIDDKSVDDPKVQAASRVFNQFNAYINGV